MMDEGWLYVVIGLVAVCSIAVGFFIGYWYQEFRYEEREASWAKKLKRAREECSKALEVLPFG